MPQDEAKPIEKMLDPPEWAWYVWIPAAIFLGIVLTTFFEDAEAQVQESPYCPSDNNTACAMTSASLVPAPAPPSEGPGFELVALVAALSVALVLVRRKL